MLTSILTVCRVSQVLLSVFSIAPKFFICSFESGLLLSPLICRRRDQNQPLSAWLTVLAADNRPAPATLHLGSGPVLAFPAEEVMRARWRLRSSSHERLPRGFRISETPGLSARRWTYQTVDGPAERVRPQRRTDRTPGGIRAIALTAAIRRRGGVPPHR